MPMNVYDLLLAEIVNGNLDPIPQVDLQQWPRNTSCKCWLCIILGLAAEFDYNKSHIILYAVWIILLDESIYCMRAIRLAVEFRLVKKHPDNCTSDSRFVLCSACNHFIIPTLRGRDPLYSGEVAVNVGGQYDVNYVFLVGKEGAFFRRGPLRVMILNKRYNNKCHLSLLLMHWTSTKPCLRRHICYILYTIHIYRILACADISTSMWLLTPFGSTGCITKPHRWPG